MINFLETKRLILKPIDPSHLEDLFLLRSDPDVMKYIGEGAIQTKEEVEDFIQCGKGYFEKYGLDFFSVFEKETNQFVGQAGLFHIGFNIKQDDIELAYRLHKKFWQKGYATELAKVLIDYGFNQLSLPKIIAAVHSENEGSRRVMEKAGMSYQGIIDFRGKPLPCYVIYPNKIAMDQFELVPASMADYPIIQNMASYYSYDMSEYMDWTQEEDGTQSVGMDYIKYWNSETIFPFLIKRKNELAGFVIVDKDVSDLSNDYNIAQFFVLRRFKRKGVGQQVAFKCFDQFPGHWEVFVMPQNEGAYRFWRSIIKKYTHNKFKEYTKKVGNSVRNIFEFSSAAV